MHVLAEAVLAKNGDMLADRVRRIHSRIAGRQATLTRQKQWLRHDPSLSPKRRHWYLHRKDLEARLQFYDNLRDRTKRAARNMRRRLNKRFTPALLDPKMRTNRRGGFRDAAAKWVRDAKAGVGISGRRFDSPVRSTKRKPEIDRKGLGWVRYKEPIAQTGGYWRDRYDHSDLRLRVAEMKSRMRARELDSARKLDELKAKSKKGGWTARRRAQGKKIQDRIKFYRDLRARTDKAAHNIKRGFSVYYDRVKVMKALSPAKQAQYERIKWKLRHRRNRTNALHSDERQRIIREREKLLQRQQLRYNADMDHLDSRDKLLRRVYERMGGK